MLFECRGFYNLPCQFSLFICFCEKSNQPFNTFAYPSIQNGYVLNCKCGNSQS